MLTKRFRLFYWCALLLLILPSIAFAEGRVVHHQITSQILADAGQSAERELSVYLPEEYETSTGHYPVMYLIHMFTGTNRTFLGAGASGRMTGIHVNEIVDKLIEDGQIQPMIVILPNMNRVDRVSPPYNDYLAQEIVPFVDSMYRTVPNREGRAITGHSRRPNVAREEG